MESSRKVVVVGAGAVGSTFAYALAQSGLASEIVMVDRNHDLAEGQALDLAHGLPFFPPVEVRSGGAEEYRDAAIIVVTAGAQQRPGENRLDLLQRNADIATAIIDEIVEQQSQAIVVMVSNPVDVLTKVVLERSGWPRERVIGSGTVLDSARFRYFLSQHLSVDARNVHAYILGEHGDSEFAAWSLTHVAGMQVDEYIRHHGDAQTWITERERLVEETRKSAYHVIGYKGATYFAIGLALVRIVGAILRDERSILTISTALRGEYGIDDVCLSVPCVVSREGAGRVIVAELAEDERVLLERSAGVLRKAMTGLRQRDEAAGDAQ
jgi:L-lactate dehydrogenase